MIDVENAQITEIFLGIEDHGIPALLITCAGESWSQGYGTFSLRTMDFAAALENLLRVIGTDNLFTARGKHVRVIRLNGLIRGLRHITGTAEFCVKNYYRNEKAVVNG